MEKNYRNFYIAYRKQTISKIMKPFWRQRQLPHFFAVTFVIFTRFVILYYWVSDWILLLRFSSHVNSRRHCTTNFKTYGSALIISRRKKCAVGHSVRSASIASGASFPCHGRFGMAKRRHTVSRRSRAPFCVIGTLNLRIQGMFLLLFSALNSAALTWTFLKNYENSKFLTSN